MIKAICQRLMIAAAVVSVPVQAADELPQRKPGLWEIATEMSMMPGRAMTMRQCIDSKTDTDLMARTEQERRNCSKQRIWRDGDSFRIESVCKADASTVTTNGVFSGDFSSAYTGDIHSHFDPPLNGMVESRMKISARHLGPCKSGQKPGGSTLSVPGIGTVDLEQMMKNMPKMPGR